VARGIKPAQFGDGFEFVRGGLQKSHGTLIADFAASRYRGALALPVESVSQRRYRNAQSACTFCNRKARIFTPKHLCACREFFLRSRLSAAGEASHHEGQNECQRGQDIRRPITSARDFPHDHFQKLSQTSLCVVLHHPGWQSVGSPLYPKIEIGVSGFCDFGMSHSRWCQPEAARLHREEFIAMEALNEAASIINPLPMRVRMSREVLPALGRVRPCRKNPPCNIWRFVHYMRCLVHWLKTTVWCNDGESSPIMQNLSTAPSSSFAQPCLLQRGAIEVAIDPVYGTLLSIRDSKRDIELVGEQLLAENFRLLVPLPDWRGHYIIGREQKLAKCHVGDGEVELVWRDLHSKRGIFPIEFRLRIALEEDAVVFRASLANRTEFLVEEVWAPALGGMANQGEADDWQMHYTNGLGNQWAFYRQCRNVYLGPSNPTDAVSYPGTASMPWLDLSHTKGRKGVYFCQEDPEPRFGSWVFQMHPSANWGGTSYVWPDPAVEKRPVGLTLAWTAFAHVAQGAEWVSAPFAMRFHEGIWYEGARLYRQWYDQHFTIDRTNSWLDQEDAWQSTIISYPEDTIGYRFRDLPKLAAAALSAGIRVLQIDGWDQGGIDRDYPHYVPDPRLGTVEDLREAIRECQALGVRVLLFSNLHVANIETEWFKKELHSYTIRDSRGNPEYTMGWEYNTIAGLVGNTKPRMHFCNPAHSEFSAIMQGTYERIADLGADGTQVDKVWCGMAGIDGHPELKHLAPELSVTAPVVEAFARHRAMTDTRRKDYGIASETHWDRLFPYVEASYARHWYEDAIQSTSVTFPEFRQTCCVTGSSDFALVANCIRLGHIINIEADCLHASIAEEPLMRDFVSKALELRRGLWDVLWMSHIIDPVPHVEVKADPRVKFTLHESRTRPGAFALVLNHFDKEPLPVRLSWKTLEPTMLHTIRQSPIPILADAEIQILPGDCAVIAAKSSEQKFLPDTSLG